MTEAKVLLVDDDQDFLEAMAERLEARGFGVTRAASGKEGLDEVSSGSFDAVILDLQMPGMDGIETLRGMLEKNPKLQVIMLTGRATVGATVEALKLGAADFVEKPAKIEDLLEKIRMARSERLIVVEKEQEAEIRKILQGKSW